MSKVLRKGVERKKRSTMPEKWEQGTNGMSAGVKLVQKYRFEIGKARRDAPGPRGSEYFRTG